MIVAIVENDAGYAAGVRALLESAPGFDWVGGCATAEEAVERLPPLKPDVVLMDIRLPGASGIECVRDLKDLLSDTAFLMLSAFEDDECIWRALKAGAKGYITKEEPPQRLLEAIGDAHANRAPMSAVIARKVMAMAAKLDLEPEASRLSPREREALDLLAHGYRYKEIADKMRISVHTVRTHIGNIYEKLHVSCRREAVRKRPFLRPD